MLPPKNLYHPVLPFRSKGKLTFSLCAACTDARQISPCRHSDQDRALTGAWVSLELKKALENGYKIVEVYEVWHYPYTVQYDPETKTGGLFAGYINDFLRLKQEVKLTMTVSK